MSKKQRILQILKRSAEREAQKLLEEARTKTKEMERATEEEMDRERERRLSELGMRLAVERARRIGAADHLREEKILRAEHKVVSEIVEEVEKRLSKLREDRELYRKVMEKLIEEALQGFEGEHVKIYVNPEDVEIVRGILSQKGRSYQLSPDEGVIYGVVIEDPKRGYRVYNTFEHRLRKAKMILLEKLSEILEV